VGTSRMDVSTVADVVFAVALVDMQECLADNHLTLGRHTKGHR
jgi:hypothetical protein